MIRAAIVLGTVIDLLIVLFLLIGSGWVIDSWKDTRVPYTGLIVTTTWLIAFLFAAGAPVLAYGLSRRKAKPGRVLMTLWLPAFVLVTICVLGLAISPP